MIRTTRRSPSPGYRHPSPALRNHKIGKIGHYALHDHHASQRGSRRNLSPTPRVPKSTRLRRTRAVDIFSTWFRLTKIRAQRSSWKCPARPASHLGTGPACHPGICPGGKSWLHPAECAKAPTVIYPDMRRKRLLVKSCTGCRDNCRQHQVGVAAIQARSPTRIELDHSASPPRDLSHVDHH